MVAEPISTHFPRDPTLMSDLVIQTILFVGASRAARLLELDWPPRSRMICTAVLSSPKVTEQEAASFARMGSVSEDVLRAIGNNRAWM